MLLKCGATFTTADIGRTGSYSLEVEMCRDYGGFGNIDNEIDDKISYYASDEDGVYYCLEMATGEEIN